MRRVPWKGTDPLYRGDSSAGVAVPDPLAKLSVVEHVLYLGGRGRRTQFSSTTESEEVAEHFGGANGCVYLTKAALAAGVGAKHLSRRQLLENLRGFGKGKAKWTDKWEVAQAAQYVALWSEHLLDWSGVTEARIASHVGHVFRKR
jgi:hypothetical protein